MTENFESTLIWWKKARFGLFIHWGLYSLLEGYWNGERSVNSAHIQCRSGIPLAEYAALAEEFNPQQFNASYYAKLARKAGMNYLVVTAKHHDGFAMYNSKVSDYNIVSATPFERDPLLELSKACIAEELGFGVYYSHGRDWEHPHVPTGKPGTKSEGWRSNLVDYPEEKSKDLTKYIREKALPQVEEIAEYLPRTDLFWFDTPEQITPDLAEPFVEAVRKHKPECIINSRIDNEGALSDFLEAADHSELETEKPWETPDTLGRYWGYHRDDTDWKTPETVLERLHRINKAGGNYLLNVGPDRNGQIPEQAEEILKKVGRHLEAEHFPLIKR
jgi:alpha-L-fucosidase